MSARVLRGLLSPSQPYVCLSCRRQVAVEGGRTRRHRYTTQKDSNEGIKESGRLQGYVGEAEASSSGSRSRIRDIIRGFARGEDDSGGKNRESNDGNTQDLTARSTAEANVSL